MIARTQQDHHIPGQRRPQRRRIHWRTAKAIGIGPGQIGKTVPPGIGRDEAGGPRPRFHPQQAVDKLRPRRMAIERISALFAAQPPPHFVKQRLDRGKTPQIFLSWRAAVPFGQMAEVIAVCSGKLPGIKLRRHHDKAAGIGMGDPLLAVTVGITPHPVHDDRNRRAAAVRAGGHIGPDLDRRAAPPGKHKTVAAHIQCRRGHCWDRCGGGHRRGRSLGRSRPGPARGQQRSDSRDDGGHGGDPFGVAIGAGAISSQMASSGASKNRLKAQR